MNFRKYLAALSIALLSLTGCQSDADFSESQASFQERYEAAETREQPLLDSGVTANMVEGSRNVTEEFFPEAAARIAQAFQISKIEAESLLRREMKLAADRAEQEYVEEFGYGSIVRIIRAAEEQSVVVDAIRSSGEELNERLGM